MRLHQRLRREHGRHADDWLITYADTITLLLCLFVIILSIKTAHKTVAHDTVPPDAPARTQPEAPVFEVPVLAAAFAVPVRRPPETEDVFAAPPPVFTAPADTGDDAEVPIAADTPVVAPPPPKRAPTPAATVDEASLPSVLNRLTARGTPAVEQQGERITTLQISSAAFYSSGQATIGEPGKAILRDIAVTLKSAAFAAYHISIEGHTDDAPISTAQFQSNWELSTARAAAVVRFLLEQGISPGKLTAAGYADTFPIAPNRTADGAVIPENQARNRRVVIRLEKLDSAPR